jgi:hypothetical protein
MRTVLGKAERAAANAARDERLRMRNFNQANNVEIDAVLEAAIAADNQELMEEAQQDAQEAGAESLRNILAIEAAAASAASNLIPVDQEG